MRTTKVTNLTDESLSSENANIDGKVPLKNAEPSIDQSSNAERPVVKPLEVEQKRSLIDRFFDYWSLRSSWEKLSWQNIRVPIIGTFLFFQLSIFYLYLFLPNQVCAKLVEPFQKFYVFFSLFQAYGVFSPNPAIANSHIIASVMYDDGSTRLYPMLRINRMGLIEKIVRERHRKFLEDNIPQPTNAKLLDDLARFVARQCNDLKPSDSGKPPRTPVYVTLIYYWSEVPPIIRQKPNVPHFNSRVLCSYPVIPEDLK